MTIIGRADIEYCAIQKNNEKTKHLLNGNILGWVLMAINNSWYHHLLLRGHGRVVFLHLQYIIVVLLFHVLGHIIFVYWLLGSMMCISIIIIRLWSNLQK
jgi:hypothetical protein